MEACQRASAHALYIAVPNFIAATPDPATLSKRVEGAVKSLHKAGLAEEAPIFLAGHSLGGIVLQDHVIKNPSAYKGVVLMGSFIARKYRNDTSIPNPYKCETPFPTPALTVGAELDGLAWVTRMAEAYWHQVQESSCMEQPVVVVPGASHMQFASGKPPSFVAKHDMKPEISYDDAHSAIADAVSGFIDGVMGVEDGWDTVAEAVQATGEFVQPILDAYELEASYHLQPPCEHGVDIHGRCWKGSPWTEQVSQPVMGGMTDIDIEVTDALHAVWEIPFHLPKIWNSCSSESPQCVLNVSTVTENRYSEDDSLDIGMGPQAAMEQKVKMESRQSVNVAVGHTHADFNQTDAPNICVEINNRAIQWAKENAGNATLSRFEAIGEPLVPIGPDIQKGGGPGWIWGYLKYKRTGSGDDTQTTVQSVMMKTPDNYWEKTARGFHYCKVLSPARALEWMYVDGLFLRGKLSSQ